jgi:hypothetical protein
MRTDVERLHTPLAQYNHASPDIAYAEQLATELVNVSGAFVTVYIKEPDVDHEDIKNVWDEDANPIYRPGVLIKAYVKVNPYQFELTRWGIDAALKLKIVFSRSDLHKHVGERLLNMGDVVEVPYNDPKIKGPARFRVLTCYDTGMFKYRWLYYTADCELLTGDASLRVTHQRNSRIR